MRQTPGYRSSRRTLEKLARSYMLFECGDVWRGDWDSFRVRNLGLRAGSETGRGDTPLRLVLDMIPDLDRWTENEKALVEAIVRAKQGPDEARYLRLMQRHARLRAALIKLGASVHGGSSAS